MLVLGLETSCDETGVALYDSERGLLPPVTVQNSYSLVSRGADGDLAEALFRERMSLLAYSPLAGGILAGKYESGAQPAGTPWYGWPLSQQPTWCT